MARRKKRPWKSQETSTRSYANGKADAGANHRSSIDFPSCPRAGNYDLHTESSLLFPSWTPWLVTLLTLALLSCSPRDQSQQLVGATSGRDLSVNRR
ncbi:hypothetical protein PoB_007495500 [Plakobranchus ocellatus]|uniref:Uncharacterized protein n=1 Tax=Plakobranchus ocellatus TaxID=259542 RepID=A0AAV4DWM8_9GAST|nr:hypothetical protein PoB_007495500 [Plakobranchus ocellatus]